MQMFMAILRTFVGTMMNHLFSLFPLRVIDSNSCSVIFRRVGSRMFGTSCSGSSIRATAPSMFKGNDGFIGVTVSSISRFSIGLVQAIRATNWLVGMHPPPGSKWIVGVHAPVIRCGCLSIREGTRLVSHACRVTAALLLLNRWYI